MTAGVKDVRLVVEEAKRALGESGAQTVLFVDEVHRFSKTQQDALLPSVENRWVTLVAATTENPFFSVISPLLSRSLLLTLEPLTDDDVRVAGRAGARRRARARRPGRRSSRRAMDHLVRLSGGDGRRALTALEAAAGAADTVTLELLEQAVDRAPSATTATATSTTTSSARSSSRSAARTSTPRCTTSRAWSQAGEDPRFIARRLVVSASEDIGMADPARCRSRWRPRRRSS